MEIRKLNMMRGLAAMIVVISHFSNASGWLDRTLGMGAGQFGVMIFFILSGFLMSYLYMRQDIDRLSLKRYAVSRFARVIPLFVIIVVSSYLLQTNGIDGVLYDISNQRQLLSHLFLLSGTSVLWTIPPEIQFYVLFPLLWWIVSQREGYLYVVMAACFTALYFDGFSRELGAIAGLTYDSVLVQALPYFFVGVIFGRLYRNWQPPAYLRRNIFLLALLVIPLLYPEIFIKITGREHADWQDAGILLIVSLVFFAILFLVPDDNALLSNRIGDFLGKISYSLYLLHLPVLWQIKKLPPEHPELNLILFLLLSIAVAYASYRIIELPARNFLVSMASGKSGKRRTD